MTKTECVFASCLVCVGIALVAVVLSMVGLFKMDGMCVLAILAGCLFICVTICLTELRTLMAINRESSVAMKLITSGWLLMIGTTVVGVAIIYI